MSKKEASGKTVLLLVISGLVIFVLGFGLGIFYMSKSAKVAEAEKIKPTINILSSKVVQTATAFGAVKKIDGRNITLSYAGEEATISVKNDAQVFSSVPVNGVAKISQAIFGDIKIGDNVSITFNIGSDGKVEGNGVYIFAKK